MNIQDLGSPAAESILDPFSIFFLKKGASSITSSFLLILIFDACFANCDNFIFASFFIFNKDINFSF